MSKRIVVLGGAGLIGTHLCLRLIKEGEQVFCVDIRDASTSPLLHRVQKHPSFRFIRHDITQPFSIACDRIYNLASPPHLHFDHAMPVEILRSDILGAINALDTAYHERIPILYASSGDVYDHPHLENTTGKSCLRPLHHLYAEGKRAAEALCRAYNLEHGIDTRIARIFTTYGSGGDLRNRHIMTKMVIAALRNEDIVIFGSGEQTRTFCWVEDVVDGLIRLMECPPATETPVINLGNDHEISIRALAEKIIMLTASRSRIVHTTARLDDPRRVLPDLEIADRELGWTPKTALNEGLNRMITDIKKRLDNRLQTNPSWVKID